MPIEFTQYPSPENTGVSGDTLFRLTVAYDGTGRRISKTRWVKAQGDAGWSRGHVTHYTGIGTEVRENFAEPAKETKVTSKKTSFGYQMAEPFSRSKASEPQDRASAATASRTPTTWRKTVPRRRSNGT